MTLFTLTDSLVGSGTTGAQTLLSGNTGGLIIFGIGIAIVGIVVGAVYAFKRWAR